MNFFVWSALIGLLIVLVYIQVMSISLHKKEQQNSVLSSKIKNKNFEDEQKMKKTLLKQKIKREANETNDVNLTIGSHSIGL